MVFGVHCGGVQCYLRSGLLAGVATIVGRYAIQSSTCLRVRRPQKRQRVKRYVWKGALASLSGPVLVAVLEFFADEFALGDLSLFLLSELCLAPVVLLAGTIDRWRPALPEVMLAGTFFGIVLPYTASYFSGNVPRYEEVVAHISDLSTDYPQLLFFFWGLTVVAVSFSLFVEEEREAAEDQAVPLPRYLDYVGHVGSLLVIWPAVLPLDYHRRAEELAHRVLSPLAALAYGVYVYGVYVYTKDTLSPPTKGFGYLTLASVPSYFLFYVVSYPVKSAINVCAAVEWVSLLGAVAFVMGAHHDLVVGRVTQMTATLPKDVPGGDDSTVVLTSLAP